MPHRRRVRNPLFSKHWFADDTIIPCVQWYLRFKLSYRDLAQIMGELGVCVAPCTILRLVVRYSVDFAPTSAPWAGHGAVTKRISRLAGNGCICTAQWMHAAKRWNRT